MDLYKILGLTKSASFEKIRIAYKTLSHRYHPDRDTGDESKFKEVGEAYNILSDSTLRAEYDIGEELAPAISILQKAMVDMINNTQIPIEDVDLILSLRSNVLDAIRKRKQTIIIIEELITRFNKSIRKINKKSNTSGNIFIEAIQKRIETSENDIVIIDEDLKLHGEMLRVLDQYEENTMTMLTYAI